MKKILIIGLLEEAKSQLGNVAVFTSIVKMLKCYVSDVEISTTIQVTDKFRETYAPVNVICNRVLPRYDSIRELFVLTFNLLRVYLWRFCKNFLHLNINILIKGKELKRFIDSDIVLDFNGDIFPSDIRNPARLLTHVIDVLTIKQLGVPIVEFASSPGPFNNWFTRLVSKIVFNRVNIILNRDPISSELLKQLGIKRTPIINTACPAFLLESSSLEKVKKTFLREGIDMNVRPLIGITLAGYNLFSQRTWGKPKNFNDLSFFVPMLKYLLDDLNANVFLLPHVYRVNPYTYTHELINGPDYDICFHLFELVNGHKYKGRLKLIEGKYTASEAKGLIGQCDMYISGRLHAGVAALSQAVPTILISYGYKHKGFARLLNQEKYVYEDKDSNELKFLIRDAWRNRGQIKKTLEDRIISVKELVNLNFVIVRDIINLDKRKRNCIPKHVVDKWVKMGYHSYEGKND